MLVKIFARKDFLGIWHQKKSQRYVSHLQRYFQVDLERNGKGIWNLQRQGVILVVTSDAVYRQKWRAFQIIIWH